MKKAGFLGILAAILNSIFNFFPWYPDMIVVFGVLGGLLLLDKKGWTGLDVLSPGMNLGGSSSGRPEMKFEPIEAPEKLNEKIRQKGSVHKEINLDYTDGDSLDYYQDKKKKRVDGDQCWLIGIIGRAKGGQYGEVVAYVYDITNDDIEKYNPNVRNPEGRVQPFPDEHGWLIAEGITGKKKNSRKRGDIQIYNNNSDQSGSTGGDGG